jgi:alpha-ribazole phosphatase/probable phosphoglycerate mutase
MSITTVDIIRHGEPVGGKKYRGQIDDPLSEKGWRQMWDAVGEHRPWQQIVSSSLSRCSAFAEALAQRHQLPLKIDERFKEVGFGQWEGRERNDIRANDAELLRRFKFDPVQNRPQGAEPLIDFKQRVSLAWNDMLDEFPDSHLLLVAHAGIVRMAMHLALDIPLAAIYRIDVENASITRLRVEATEHGQRAKLVFHGGIP